MSDGLYVALSGAVAQQIALDTMATNLANAGTNGFQKLQPVFREELLKAKAGTKTAANLRFVGTGPSRLDTTRGGLTATGKPLDIALPEKAYLAVQTANGERYTRAGSLRVGPNGSLETMSGHAVLAETGSVLQVPPSANTYISADGSLREQPNPSQGPATAVGSVLGKLRIVTFDDPGALMPEGKNLLAETQASGAARITEDPIDTGAIEESNASVVEAMTNLVTINRTFEAFQKTIQAFQDADRKATSVVSG
jgi:flagellar basal body rod protein FlgG